MCTAIPFIYIPFCSQIGYLESGARPHLGGGDGCAGLSGGGGSWLGFNYPSEIQKVVNYPRFSEEKLG